MDDPSGGGGGGDDELAQPSFNDRLTIIDFPAVGAAAGEVASMAPTTAGASPAAVSLHTPTPPDVSDSDEAQFTFELVTSSSTHHEGQRLPTISGYSKRCADFSIVFNSFTVRRIPCFLCIALCGFTVF